MKITLITLIWFLVYIAGFLFVIATAGCVQRECTYKDIHFKSNYFCADASADYISVIAEGVVLEINKAAQNTDSLKLKYNYITGNIEIVTE